MSQQSTIAPSLTAHPAPQHMPSVHVRAVITWLTIFPLVTIGMFAMTQFAMGWPLVLRTFALTLVVVPLSVYLVVPQLLRAYGLLRIALTRSHRSAH